MFTECFLRFPNLRAARAWLAGALLFLFAGSVPAEICWEYTDVELAKVPLKCVQIGNPAVACSWNPNCNVDNNPSDCCMAVHDPSATQTIGDMHRRWHNCLGNFTNNAVPQPPNRGLRWFAFHRQFESDFNIYREGLGFDKIDSLEWCPGMIMPYGHFGAQLGPLDHPLGCGTGSNRPNGVVCDGCESFRRCLYLNGAGPISCPAPGAPICSVNGVTFPYTSLDQFQNADEIGAMLDVYFHGDMHTAVSDADGGGYTADCADPNCSPRDPMFWRLHKALDDVMRAWQNVKAVDVTLVIDRSGSMSAASGTGTGTRLQNAVEAADMFADLMEDGRSDGAVNRLGIVSYSSNAANAALNMPLQNVTSTLRNAGGPFANTLAALSPGGSTSIGSGVVAALEQLCTAGNCATHTPAPGENQRKAILLLTDGKENVAPCLEAGCQGGAGAAIDYTKLDVTQACAVGLGNAASINGELLTIFTERQGGIYLNNTDASGTDLKDFFAKCFAQLTDEFIGLDPSGTIAASAPAGPIVPYESCDDSRITFSAGWNRSNLAGDRLNLLVTSPKGDAWVPAPNFGELSTERSWAFKRSPLPYNGQSQGVWNMQLLRPQQAFVNGFATDSFVKPAQGTAMVRRQIQRLCPIDDNSRPTCKRVLHFEDGDLARSVYTAALKAETGMTVVDHHMERDPDQFARLLRTGGWDLIVFAHQAGADQKEGYDSLLQRQVCSGTRAIITDTRSVREAASLLRCAGAARDPRIVNQDRVVGSKDFLDVEARLRDPGYLVFSYGLQAVATNTASAEAAAQFGLAGDNAAAAIIGKAVRGGPIQWHKNVLVTGLSQLTAFAPRTVPKTGDTLKAAVRILPSVQREGGYPDARMTVEVERPKAGLGGLVKRRERVATVKGDAVDSVELQLGQLNIATIKEIYKLNDRGENGDIHPLNGTYSADLPISAAVDGMYTFHYRFDYKVGSCQARRELKQSLYVDVRVSPAHSDLVVGDPRPTQGGKRYPLTLRPQDSLGNVVGPGRSASVQCSKPCSCASRDVVDRNDGSYTIPLLVPDSVELSACSVEAFGAKFALGKRPRFPGRNSGTP